MYPDTVTSALTTSTPLILALVASLWIPGGFRHFPGSYYDTQIHPSFGRHAMQHWPDPHSLTEIWSGLNPGQRAVVLLAAARFHDPTLLPLYRQGATSAHGRVRQAAAYGYRDLIGDRPPNVVQGVSLAQGEALAREIELVAETLRVHTLVEMWVNAALATEDLALGGYSGIIPQRAAVDCWRAVDRLATVWDLETLAFAATVTGDEVARSSLLTLIEGLTLERFEPRVQGPRAVWTEREREAGRQAFDDWLDRHFRRPCRLDPERILADRLRVLGSPVEDPFGRSACGAWLRVLDGREPVWWRLAAQQLTACGAPAVEMSVLRAEDPANAAARWRVLQHFDLAKGPPPAGSGGPPSLPPVPGGNRVQ